MAGTSVGRERGREGREGRAWLGVVQEGEGEGEVKVR